MVDDSHAAHFASDRLHTARAEAVFLTKRCQGGKEPVRCVFEFDEDGKEDLPMIPVPGKKYQCELIQSLDSGDFVMVQVDLGAWHVFHPCLFEQNMGMDGVPGLVVHVKIFSGLW